VTTGQRTPRPLGELIQLILTLIVGTCLVAGVVGVIVIRIVDPSTDVGAPASSLGTLLSALAGYVIGRTRREENHA
jgi:hypothetical protein